MSSSVLRALVIALVVLAAGRADAAVRRYAVLVGNDHGHADEATLRYAERDVAKMGDVLRGLGGFAPEDIVTLTDQTPEDVRRVLISLNDRIRASSEQAMLFVYYSGHADAAGLHLGHATLANDEIVKLVRGSPATVRLLVIDSCRSGALTRGKGGHAVPVFDVALDDALASEGAIFLTASAGDEDAQESDDLQGSFFTHYLVSGMVGAADEDGDGVVVLDEAYRYAYDNTLRATSRTRAGTQHPSFRYDVRGQGKIVLTSLAGARQQRAMVTVPAGRDYLLLQGGDSGPVIAEIDADAARRTVSLRPGRYFVRGRGHDDLLEGAITVSAGGAVTIERGALHEVAYARLVRKGRGPRSVSHAALLRLGGHSSVYGDGGVCGGAALAYRADLAKLSVEVEASGCEGEFGNDSLTATTRELGAGLTVLHVWDVGPGALELGAGGGLAWLHESFDTRGVAPARDALAVQLGVTAGGTLDVGRRSFVELRATARNYFVRQQDAAAVPADLAARFSLVVTAGAGLRF